MNEKATSTPTGTIRNYGLTISRIASIAIVLTIVVMCILIIRRSNEAAERFREVHLNDTMNIVSIVVEYSYNGEGLAFELLSYIRAMPDKVVEVYDAEYAILHRLIPYGSPYLDVREYLYFIPSAEEFFESGKPHGHRTMIVDDILYDVYYRWITVGEYRNKLLIVYGYSERLFDFSFIQACMIGVVLLVMVLYLKALIFDGKILYSMMMGLLKQRVVNEEIFMQRL